MTDEIELTELNKITKRAREIITARNAEIWRLANEEDKTQEVIGEMFGLTRQRISAILKSERKRRMVEAAPSVEVQSP